MFDNVSLWLKDVHVICKWEIYFSEPVLLMIYFIYQVQSQEISEYGRSLFNIVDVKLFFF